MPDWCTSLLRVLGKEEQVKSFVEAAKGIDDQGNEQAIFFSKILPEPEDLHGVNGNIDLIQWRVENWGTKWDPYADLITSEATEEPGNWHSVFELRTPYDPPKEFAKHVAEEFKCNVLLAWFDEQRSTVNVDGYGANGVGKFLLFSAYVPLDASASYRASLEKIFAVFKCDPVIQWTRDYAEWTSSNEEDE